MVKGALARGTSWVGRTICRFRGTPAGEAIATGVALLYRSIHNVDFDMDRNGELRVLICLRLIQPRLFFDVGANEGEWTTLIAGLYPNTSVHAFEIVPETCLTLRERTADKPNVTINSFGLSDQEENIPIYIGKDSTTATAYKLHGVSYHDSYYDRNLPGQVKTAESYLQTLGIDQVDFVKIDVEGMDLRVIKGFGCRINQVRVIQFEYGIFNIASRDLLHDFCRYLTEHGFVVGKIYPRYVDFFEYDFYRENFLGSNYLAVRKDETALISVLGKFTP